MFRNFWNGKKEKRTNYLKIFLNKLYRVSSIFDKNRFIINQKAATFARIHTSMMMTIHIYVYCTYISHHWYSFSMLNRGHVMIDKWATNGDSDVSQFRSDSRRARAAKQIRLVDRSRGSIILITPKWNRITNFQFREFVKTFSFLFFSIVKSFNTNRLIERFNDFLSISWIFNLLDLHNTIQHHSLYQYILDINIASKRPQ